MGVAGAALATAASEIGAGLAYTLLLRQRKMLRLGQAGYTLRLHPRRPHPLRPPQRKMLRLG